MGGIDGCILLLNVLLAVSINCTNNELYIAKSVGNAVIQSHPGFIFVEGPISDYYVRGHGKGTYSTKLRFREIYGQTLYTNYMTYIT